MNKLRQILLTLIEIVRSRIQIFLLQREIIRLKARNYDRLVTSVAGLRRALETQSRSLADLAGQIEERDGRINLLQAEYSALVARQSESNGAATEAERMIWFQKLRSLATQIPSLRAAVAGGANLTATDILDAIAPLEEALRDLGFETIGHAGDKVFYDPSCHRAVGRGARSLTANDTVRVRFVGYTYNGRIVTKAEVSRIESPAVASALN